MTEETHINVLQDALRKKQQQKTLNGKSLRQTFTNKNTKNNRPMRVCAKGR